MEKQADEQWLSWSNWNKESSYGRRKQQEFIVFLISYMLTVAVLKLANWKNEQNDKIAALILKKEKKKKKDIWESSACADSRIGQKGTKKQGENYQKGVFKIILQALA